MQLNYFRSHVTVKASIAVKQWVEAVILVLNGTDDDLFAFIMWLEVQRTFSFKGKIL